MEDLSHLKNKKNQAKTQALSFFFGGLLPIIAFTVIEEKYGTVAGIIAGMVFGFGEIIFEYVKYKKVSTITWIGNFMILFLGGISLVFDDGLWFKLQPAIFEAFFAVFLWGGLVLKKNFLVLMAEKQGQRIPDLLKSKFNGLTFRIGVFFAIQAALAVWAAFDWSTANWALLKGVGLTVSFVVYLVLEMIFLRLQIKKGSPQNAETLSKQNTLNKN